MRKITFWVATFSVIIFAFCTASIAFARSDLWPKKGELCWEAEGGSLIRLNVMEVEVNNYLVFGTHIDGSHIGLINGNAIVYVDVIKINTSGIKPHGFGGVDEGISADFGYVELDPETLDGDAKIVGVDYWGDGNDPHPRHDSVGLTNIPCP